MSAVVAFGLVQLFAGFVIDWAYPEIRFPHMHNWLAKLRLEPRTPDLVCLGSSRFASAINSDELTHELRRLTGRDDFRALNAAVPGGDFIVMERMFREMQAAGVRPANLVIETAPYSLLRVNGWYDMPSHSPARMLQHSRARAELIHSDNPGRFVLARFLPLYVHRYAVIKKLCVPAPAVQAEPLGPPNEMTEEQMDRLLDPKAPVSAKQALIASVGAESMVRPYRDYEVGGNSIRALERILDGCARQGTRVLLVGTPLSASTATLLTAEIDDKYHGYLKGLESRSSASPFVECRSSVLPDSLMADHHHCCGPTGRSRSVASAARGRRAVARRTRAADSVGESSEGRLMIVTGVRMSRRTEGAGPDRPGQSSAASSQQDIRRRIQAPRRGAARSLTMMPLACAERSWAPRAAAAAPGCCWAILPLRCECKVTRSLPDHR